MLVGIDLGTTNSLVCVYRDGKTELIPNSLGHVLTPSAVGVADDGSFIVGLPARERAATHPRLTATAFKRWMGTDHTVMLGQRRMRAEELSALVLGALKADAEAYLGQPVTEAVITVPAYFNDVQRKATQAAGRLAGLKVERLLNEPTAAGLAYGLQERADHSAFLVFDLGGGTFDVSVLEYFEGVIEVRASAGDTRLGGEDFVKVLVDWFVEKIPALNDADKEAIASDNALWRSAEQAKRDLSERETAQLQLQRNEATHTLEVTRAEYEKRCADLLLRLRRPLERALMDAKLDPSGLSEVVLVGGASRMPIVRQVVTRLFGRLPLRTINPDETVARGAAIQAALKERNAALDEVVLTDVMPYSLGIVVSEEIDGRHYPNRFSPIIERNTAVPVSRVQSYSTVQDGQTAISIDVRQGESPIGTENLKLGSLDVQVPAMPRGEINVNLRFTYDINGLLEVEAHIPATGQTTQSVIQRSAQVMSEQQIAAALEKLRTLKIHPRDKQENVYLVSRAKRLYEDRLGHARQDVAHALMRFEAALDSQDEHLIRQHRTEFKAYLDSIDKGFVL
ncbi:Hsp70 family protein [Variovorax paradoxus]|jgi:molecular chaperone HscC|uniref:Hsp70 family protein n=1 Tax=Variovorax paradoxus TaxID=34073 RepID=UPI002480C68F|nr:molecular chaperone HscC [Variovorax paradoxus]WGT66165.1 molecular chaperone HscC [Variovorax paradoxus]